MSAPTTNVLDEATAAALRQGLSGRERELYILRHLSVVAAVFGQSHAFDALNTAYVNAYRESQIKTATQMNLFLEEEAV